MKSLLHIFLLVFFFHISASGQTGNCEKVASANISAFFPGHDLSNTLTKEELLSLDQIVCNNKYYRVVSYFFGAQQPGIGEYCEIFVNSNKVTPGVYAYLIKANTSSVFYFDCITAVHVKTGLKVRLNPFFIKVK